MELPAEDKVNVLEAERAFTIDPGQFDSDDLRDKCDNIRMSFEDMASHHQFLFNKAITLH